MKELLTASRINSFLSCPRKHFYRYELGLKPNTDAQALRFGSAWALAMEARWQGKTYDEAIAIANGGSLMEEIDQATLAGLLHGYYRLYEGTEIFKFMHPEVKFQHSIAGSNTFDAAGKIDGLGMLHDGRLAIVESKTTRENIAPDSDYWLRLRFNIQILQYVYAARKLGWNVEVIIYDVTRKPAIEPVQIPILDINGFKIVNDVNGNRIFKANGEPRQSADKEKGYTLLTSLEQPDQFGRRLADDAEARPDFYFARREVPVLDDDLIEFNVNRVSISRTILGCRHEQKKVAKPEQAWPRNSSTAFNCNNCEFSQFCLQNISVNPAKPPAGFQIGGIHSELEIAV